MLEVVCPFSQVKLSRKLGKLFNGEAFLSTWEHLRRRTHPVDVEGILSTLNPIVWTQLRQRYPIGPAYPANHRFADAAYWIKISVERAQNLWLDRSPPLRILDLGCGGGYFAYVCRWLGHESIGLDIDEEPLFREATQLLQVQRVIFQIARGIPLPDLGNGFDLITAYRICFHKIAKGRNGTWVWWGPEDWKFFLNDVRTRLLKPTGRLMLDFNPLPDGSYYSSAVRDLFRLEGARIFRSKVFFGTDWHQLS